MNTKRAFWIVALTTLMLAGTARAYGQVCENRYPIVKDGKVGFIDSQGREVIPPRFSSAGIARFENCLAPVFEPNRGSGYIDVSGKFVVGPTMVWGWGRPFHEDIAGVLIWGKNGTQNRPGWIDRTGRIVFSGLGIEGTYFSSGLMPIPRAGKWGYVNKNFQFVIKPQFEMAYPFSEGLAEIERDGKSGFIDTSGKIVIEPKYDMAWQFHDGLARVRYDSPDGTVMTVEGEQTRYRYQYGFVNHQGREVIPLQFEEATYFSDGYAMAIPSNFKLFGIIDKTGTFVHPPEFESAEEFSEGLAVACMDQQCGFVNTSGAWVVRPTFVHAESFRNGLASVSWKSGEYGYIDKTGKTVWKHTPSVANKQE